jgi:hypothetical protein
MHEAPPSRIDGAPSADDERAIARYLYLLRTAPPEAIEQVHADAFRALTEAQRSELLARIAQVLPPYERGLAVPVNGTPIADARPKPAPTASSTLTTARLASSMRRSCRACAGPRSPMRRLSCPRRS